jgi:predicted O-methyltransferase YrrM
MSEIPSELTERAELPIDVTNLPKNRAGTVINPMMDMPIVQPQVLNFLRNSQRPLDGQLAELQQFAVSNRMPVIPHEVVVFLQFILSIHQPERILEVGTAIGFSAAVMAKSTPETTKIVTIDRYNLMIERAKQNFQRLGIDHRVELLEGDAEKLLPQLADDSNQIGSYDFIFLDCAKSKYIEFLPFCLTLLSKRGIILIDDVFQGGTVFDDSALVKHSRRRIWSGLNALLAEASTNVRLQSTAIPLGDGLLMVKHGV